ncbi:hypothetical protein [Anaerosinus massiliensis]|uniref:hypothetical protein n=1 Tax=Massilibacillus massiliensis TaxID=1806837 RepID=UPI000DA5ED83|nr:hypothetical protein [Massilibacillus massiliensis]
MLGLSKEELDILINNLEQTKYFKIYNEEITKYYNLLKPDNASSNDITARLSEFTNIYLDKIVKPLITDLIEENNKKIEQDIRQVIAQYLR